MTRQKIGSKRRIVAALVAVGMTILAGAPAAAARQGRVTSITLSPASPVAPGTSVSITVAASSPCGAIEVNFGDGADVTFPISAPPMTVQHAYANAGTFAIVAKGQGNCSGQAATSLSVQTGVVQAVQLSPASPVTPGSTVTIKVIAQAPCPVIALKFGDGASATVNVSSLPLNQQHVYASVGSFTVTASGQSGCGGQATAALQVVSVPVTQPDQTAQGTITARHTAPDLVLDGAGLPLFATLGQNLTYPIRLRNIGDAGAQNVVVRMQLPREVDFVRADNNQFASCTVSGQAGRQGGVFVTCTKASVAAGERASVDIVTKPINGLVDGDQMIFGATVDPDNTVRESNEFNNTVGAVTKIQATSDLEVTIVSVQYPSFRLFSPSIVSCAPDGTSHANAHVRVRITNHGPGQSRPTTLKMDWVSGVSADSLSDCPDGTTCVSGKCIAASGPGQPAPLFGQCPIGFIFPGAIQECVFNIQTSILQGSLGTATVDPTRQDVNDPNRSNNSKPIR